MVSNLTVAFLSFWVSIWLQLLRIEEELGHVRYAGEAFRSP